MDNTLYDYSPITERPKITWPGGARLAFYVGLNVEHFVLDAPSTSLTKMTEHLKPDPLNHGWRDYGNRVGIWRLIEIFDRYGVRPSVLLNSDVAAFYPQVIQAGIARRWAWLAHGKNNSTLHSGLSAEEEPRLLAEIVDTIERGTGYRPKGWMGPALTETHQTPALLKELGLNYVLDWTADDQPFPLNVEGMISVPYSVEMNDINFFVFHSFTGAQFAEMVIDQFEQLYSDSEASGRVMPLALHPFVIGQAMRAGHLDKVLKHITAHNDVWVTTSDEIAAHYIAHNVPGD